MKAIAAIAAIAAATLLLVVFLWRPWDGDKTPPARPPPARPPPAREEAPRPAGRKIPLESAVTPVIPPPPANDLTKLTPEELQRVRDAIDHVELTLRDHAAALGGNPVGTNAEITAALLGDNARQLKLEVPGGSSVNPAGELCDPWGTPWFFHQLSGTKMELRSAGPDRRLYTDDDFVR